ncbi:hypothetical protein E1B28_003912 [Marasmius oreades]|uniref:Uncharacterized protein n=1 Tax=Marasmius oreades TaxID=181124 RepID=A0A9P7UXI5_9AGAR|nr:uncharacterized protein E1B28_003912 [Marasmius oreades]KAG7096482.1 hypothetical protein E1B28_003912 [Marasmius oreades]
MHFLPALAISATVFKTAQASVFPRQSDLPPECQPTCTTSVATFVENSNCPNNDIAQCCTVQFEQGVADCYLCLGKSINSMAFGQAQMNIDGLVKTCVQSGFMMTKITLPGQDPNRPLTTAPASLSHTSSSSLSIRPPPSLSTGGTAVSQTSSSSLSIRPPPTGGTTVSQTSLSVRPPPSLSTGGTTPTTTLMTTTSPSGPVSTGNPAGNSAPTARNVGNSAVLSALILLIVVTGSLTLP